MMVVQKVFCADCKIRIHKSFGGFGVMEGTEYEDGWRCELCSQKLKKKQ